MYRHAVDAKGRVAVPATLRRGLPQSSVVTAGPDRRLVIWPADAWEREQELFRRTAESPSQRRRFMRQLAAVPTTPFEVDAQGRMLLTTAQRRWAGIDSGAVFAGVSGCVEIVGEELWDGEQLELEPDEFTRLHDLVHRAAEDGGTSQ
jgi:MraZ protein